MGRPDEVLKKRVFILTATEGYGVVDGDFPGWFHGLTGACLVECGRQSVSRDRRGHRDNLCLQPSACSTFFFCVCVSVCVVKYT